MKQKKKDLYSKSLSYYAWQRLKKNKLAMLGICVIIFAAFIALLGSTIRPDGTPHANSQKLQLAKKHPGFQVDILLVRKNYDIPRANFFGKILFGGEQSEFKVIPIHKFHFEGSSMIVEEYTGMNKKFTGKQIPINLVDIIYPIDSRSRYEEDENGNVSFQTMTGEKVEMTIRELQEMVKSEHLKAKKFWLGTDQFGRDLLSRLMAGTLVSLSVGFISVFISLIIGISLGAIGGYFGGIIDDIIMWIINVVWSIPTLLLVIAITFALGKGFWQIFVAVGLTMWVEVARVVRGQVLSIREKEFIEAGKALGFGNARIISKHVLPNVMGPVIVISAANFASAILIESGLSFLGIGLQPPMASWGRMIKEHYGFIMVNGAYLAILPGIAIMLMVLAFMLVGNGLRDAIDTKSIDDNGTGSPSG